MERILIVDDKPANIQVLGTILTEAHYEIEYAQNGVEAIDFVRTEEFDLILLDIMMPIMNGFEVCKTIRKDAAYDNIPIIFLTAKTDKESLVKGFELGGQDYLTKPFDSHELLARVKTHIELKKSREKLKDVNKWLEEQVALKTKELQTAYANLEQLDDAKFEFLKILSHEIRTPLNGIVGPLQLLKSRINEEDLIKLLQMLEYSVKRLEKFSNDAILVTSLKTNKHVTIINEENAFKLLEFQLMKFSEQIASKSLKINLDNFQQDLLIKTDSNLLSESLMRIIKNAIEYSVEYSEITIESDISDDQIIYTISDEGKGFDMNFLEQDLSMFKPDEGEGNQKLGIDLYLVNLILKTLGGKLEYGNNKNKGAYVKLFLPM